jgi:hypothetical protein
MTKTLEQFEAKYGQQIAVVAIVAIVTYLIVTQ